MFLLSAAREANALFSATTAPFFNVLIALSPVIAMA
jgi:hypothetical protein